MDALFPELDGAELGRMRERLQRLGEQPPQVLLLEGGSEAQRLALAHWWACRLKCPAPSAPCCACPVCRQVASGEHLDILAYDGRISNKDDEENPGLVRAFNMDRVRELKSRLRDAPHGPGYRVVLLAGLTLSRDEAANALLKSLEEPLPSTRFVLLCAQREQLLPTLVSRSLCLTLPWPDSSARDPELQPWEEALGEFLRSGRGLFERSLTSADVLSSSQAIALAHGASLTNIEFMQMMPGFIEPKRNLVFNEKTWRYVHVDQPVDIADDKLKDLLEQRSGYGPFTSRLASRAIDLAIDQAGPEGLTLHYDFPREDVPEFVQTFATWLQDEHAIAPTVEMRVAMYAHAANGGIRIDKTAYTGVEGLYACGEATGGMHGADRIGGLSSANGIVFGRIAGASAAQAAQNAPEVAPKADIALPRFGIATTDAERLTHSLKHTMSTYCMINRTEAGLSEALNELEGLKTKATTLSAQNAQDSEVAALARLQSQIQLATEMVKAMRKRTESLGSHYRAD